MIFFFFFLDGWHTFALNYIGCGLLWSVRALGMLQAFQKRIISYGLPVTGLRDQSETHTVYEKEGLIKRWCVYKNLYYQLLVSMKAIG